MKQKLVNLDICDGHVVEAIIYHDSNDNDLLRLVALGEVAWYCGTENGWAVIIESNRMEKDYQAWLERNDSITSIH